jgi:hypothetical protein
MNVADKEQRVLLKQQIADDMATVALRLNISADAIKGRIQANAPDREGWLTGLASVVALAPNPGDGARLLDVAGLTTQKFVKYRILLALYSLKARRLLDDADTDRARRFIEECLKTDDPSLERKAQATLDFFAAS